MRVFIGIALTLSSAVAVSAKDSMTFSSTCFVPPASPTRTRVLDPTSSPAFNPSPQQMAPAILRVHNMQLDAKKKKKAAPAAAKKIQVKMLKHVAGTGQAGQVIMVTPAFFNNKLRPTKSAEIISDAQVEKERAAAAADAKEQLEQATALQEKVSETVLVISRKAGPDGQLFGGIGPKVIMEELKSQLGDDFLSSKTVKVSAVLNEDGKKIRGDIKHTGKFGATIALTKAISAKLELLVEGTS